MDTQPNDFAPESTDADGAELGSRLCASVLLVLEHASALADAPLPNDEHNEGGGNTLTATAASTNGTYGAPPATDLGAVADLSREANRRDIAPAPDDHLAEPAHSTIAVLVAAGHSVTWTTRADWELDTQGTLSGEPPHVVVVEASAPKQEIVQLCRELRASPVGVDAGILAITPSARRGEKARAALTDSLLEAGADDFLTANASDAEVLARVRVLAELARTRRSLESARAQLRTQLQTDEQTRLLNRRFFFQAAHRECSRARRYNSELSCLMIEIDHFKRITAITGYECGEAMLRAVALVLRDLTRDSDIVARFDEDKFAVLLPETTIEGATRLREKVQQAVVASDFHWQSAAVPLSVSGGEANRNRELYIAEAAAERLDLEDDAQDEHIDGEPLSTREELAELLAAADAALFVARRGARFPSIVGEQAGEHHDALRDDNDQLPSVA